MVSYNTGQLGALFDACGRGSRKDRGNALEELIAVTFAQVPGIEVAGRNLFCASGAAEIDVALFNHRLSDGLPFLPTVLLAEAKNWQSRLGSQELAWFDWKLASVGQSVGFFVSAAGITGNARLRRDAYDVLFHAQSQGRQLILLLAGELAGLGDTDDLRELIKHRLVRLTAKQDPFS